MYHAGTSSPTRKPSSRSNSTGQRAESKQKKQWLEYDGRAQAFPLNKDERLTLYDIGEDFGLTPLSIIMKGVAITSKLDTGYLRYKAFGGKSAEDPIHVRGRKAPPVKQVMRAQNMLI